MDSELPPTPEGEKGNAKRKTSVAQLPKSNTTALLKRDVDLPPAPKGEGRIERLKFSTPNP
jgi:hypothetical protein